MRSVMISFICVLCLLFTARSQSDLTAYSVRKQELQDCLGISMSQTMREHKLKGSYGMNDKDTFTAAFIRSFVSKLNSNSDITIKVITLDLKEGFFEAEVTEQYVNMLGQKQQLSLRRAVILEEPDV